MSNGYEGSAEDCCARDVRHTTVRNRSKKARSIVFWNPSRPIYNAPRHKPEQSRLTLLKWRQKNSRALLYEATSRQRVRRSRVPGSPRDDENAPATVAVGATAERLRSQPQSAEPRRDMNVVLRGPRRAPAAGGRPNTSVGSCFPYQKSGGGEPRPGRSAFMPSAVVSATSTVASRAPGRCVASTRCRPGRSEKSCFMSRSRERSGGCPNGPVTSA